MEHDGSRSSSLCFDLDRVKIESPESDGQREAEVAPSPHYYSVAEAQPRFYHDVMHDISQEMRRVDSIIGSYPPEQQNWIVEQIQRNEAEIHASVPWTRREEAKNTTKYKQMLLAQRKKAVEQLNQQVRVNPRRAAKSKVAENGYREEEDEDDDDIQVIHVVKAQGQKKKSKKRKGKGKR